MATGVNGVDAEAKSSAHVIVIGNEKGGSGKSTLAIHVAVALMQAQYRVATIDLDGRQSSFTHYIERRREWSKHARLYLELPAHHRVMPGESLRIDENEASELADFSAAVAAVEHAFDFVIIDTPGADTYLGRFAHSMADTLITPLNDSTLDLDVLATIDPVTLKFTGGGHYAEMVREARRQRREIDAAPTDWIVVRNRLTAAAARHRQIVREALDAMAEMFNFRCVEGFAERAVYREFFPRGVTALDPIDADVLGTRPSLSHVAAQEEARALVASLNLPTKHRDALKARARP